MSDQTSAPARFPRRNILFFLALLAALLSLYIVMVEIPGRARGQLSAMLASAGFEDARINHIDFNPSGFTASGIKLDRHELDVIQRVDVTLSWPRFFYASDIEAVSVSGVKISITENQFSVPAQKIFQNLLKLPPYRIAVSDVTIDLNSEVGSLRFLLDAGANTDNNAASRDVTARLRADQYQLGFESEWSGVLLANGTLDISGNVTDGRLNAGPARISRINGWSALTVAADQFALQGQLAAGSASFMDIPLQDLTLVADRSVDQGNALIRFGISGVPDVRFSGDYTLVAGQSSFESSLEGAHLGRFLKTVAGATGGRAPRGALSAAEPFSLRAIFQPERRFAGGPLPFALTLQTGTIVNEGTVLFYPDSFDLRGSIETGSSLASDLQNYFKIPSENIKQNFVRLDGNAKGFFSRDESNAANIQPASGP